MTTNQRRAQGEAIALARRNGHRIDFPKVITENCTGKCKACGREIKIRFDVPCGYLIGGTGATNGCQYGAGF